MKKIVIIIVGLFYFVTSFSQSSGLGLKLSVLHLQNTDQYTFNNQFSPAVGLEYIKPLSEHFDFVSGFNFAKVNFVSKDANGKTSASMYNSLEVAANYKLLSTNAKFKPYLTGGMGVSTFDRYKYNTYALVGGGFQFKTSEASYIRFGASFKSIK